MHQVTRVIVILSLLGLFGASTTMAGDGASLNFSLRFWQLHFADKPIPLEVPSAASSLSGACADIHSQSWSCSSAPVEVTAYRKDLEHRWRELDALMTRFRNWPQRYDRYDFDHMVSQFGLNKSQLHTVLARKVRGTRRLVVWYERAKYGGGR